MLSENFQNCLLEGDILREFETILFEEKENGIWLLRFNRPDKLNALSIRLLEEFMPQTKAMILFMYR